MLSGMFSGRDISTDSDVEHEKNTGGRAVTCSSSRLSTKVFYQNRMLNMKKTLVEEQSPAVVLDCQPKCSTRIRERRERIEKIVEASDSSTAIQEEPTRRAV